MDRMSGSFLGPNLRSGSIFVSLWKLHSGGQGETKREPDTNLLRNVCRPLFWLCDICRISQSELLPLFVFLVCKFFTRGKNAFLENVRVVKMKNGDANSTLARLTWDQALFLFRFENYIPAGKAKRKESLIQSFYETSAAHFFDW